MKLNTKPLMVAGLVALSLQSTGAFARPSKSLFIHDVQGSGSSSPVTNQQVTIEGIVVGDFQNANQFSGFYVQEEDVDADNDPLTSEGIFIYTGSSGTNVNVGDKVSVKGTVKEYAGITELSSVSITVLGSGYPLPSAATLTLPLTSANALEQFEGMRVTLPQTLTVTENYSLGRYGKVSLSSGGRLMMPTNVVAPGSAAIALQAQNDLNRILLDDGLSIQNPDPIVLPAPQLTAANTLRSGDTLTAGSGILTYVDSAYTIEPTQAVNFVQSNPRTAAPASVGGTLKVASFNVLNYFNGNGTGGGFPTTRGADTSQEFTRQRDKIIAAITALDADIIGLMEIENDGYGNLSAIQDLVNGLNAAAPTGTSYAFVNPGLSKVGTDEIAVGILYRTETVATVGSPAILDSSVDSRFDDSRNRPAIAQTFRDISGNGVVTIAVNHLKSKGSSCSSVNDPDTGDGQGNCNLTRTSAAQALSDWLTSDPTHSGDSDFLIIGDLNSYAKEDPITALKNGGFTDLLDTYQGANNAYSYVYMGQSGYMDHALANGSLSNQVTGAAEWHINADEPPVLDYNTEYKSTNQQSLLYAADAYRASDHDALVIGLSLNP